jgi:hypothetical protein
VETHDPQRGAGILQWRLHHGIDVLEGYLADCGKWGMEYRLHMNGKFVISGRSDSQAEAQEQLERIYRRYRQQGWSALAWPAE